MLPQVRLSRSRSLRAPASIPDILRMSISGDELYDEVLAKPMIKVAARHDVSANYLARVRQCRCVPYPHRGYRVLASRHEMLFDLDS
jgi:hypothetical protein